MEHTSTLCGYNIAIIFTLKVITYAIMAGIQMFA